MGKKKDSDKDIQKYITLYDIALTYYDKEPDKTYFINELEQSIEKLPEDICIRNKALDIPYCDEKTQIMITKVYFNEDVINFFKKYISKMNIYKEYKKTFSEYSVSRYYNKLVPEEIILGGKTDIFVTKKFAEELKIVLTEIKGKKGWELRVSALENYQKKHKLLTSDEVSNLLNCSYITINKMIDEGSFGKVLKKDKRKFFDSSVVNDLRIEQQKLIKYFNEKYYTPKEIGEKYNISFQNYVKGAEEKIRFKITKVDPPTILTSYYGMNLKLYKKVEIDKMWKEYNLFIKLNETSNENPYKDFEYKVEEILDLKFNGNQLKTKELWFQHVERFFIKTRIQQKDRIMSLVNQFVRCTEVVFNIFQKEIYSYSYKEINEKFLNENVDIKRSYQRDFYIFLKKLHHSFQLEGLPLPYNVEDLNDPRNFKRIKNVDTSIYSPEEYQELYEYTGRIDLHKEKAISDVKQFISSRNSNKYMRYDSCWLYILIHLTNNWRHSTIITQIPRIDLSSTAIESLDWLLKNTPSKEDANNIIYQIGRYVTKINKTEVNAEGIFTIGEPLKIAFAIAISICEFRVRETDNSSSTLIELAGHLVEKFNPHKEYFKDFIKNFKFENRKMNRTLSTLIWSVLRSAGKGLKESQISRSHLQDKNTFKHYIKLSDEDVNKLVNQLFERNQFGFVTQSLSNLLFGAETNKKIETKRMLLLNEQFGDVYKIEATAGILNRVTNESYEVLKYLKEFDLDGLHQLFNDVMLGKLPSYQRNHQCVYLSCRYKNEFGEKPSCTTCAASIINIYALGEIMDNYMYLMKKIVEEFDISNIGEKQKLANQFFLLNKVVNQARQTFGRETVDGFVEGKTERIKQFGKELSSKNIKSYRTPGILKSNK